MRIRGETNMKELKSKTEKICVDCKKEKSIIENFGMRRGWKNRLYLRSICNPCMSIRTKTWRKNNRERFNIYQRKYQLKKYHDKRLAEKS